jgi:uncharacterized protein (TIGR02246 family)
MLSLCTLAAIVICSGCASFQSGSAGIDAGNAALMDAIRRGDAAAVAACYTRDAMLLPPNAPPAEGAQAIAESWKATLDAGIRDITLSTIEAEGRGSTAAEVGHYTIKGPDGQTLDQGKYIVLWKKEDGVWKLHRDIWNSNAAPAR